LGIKDFLKLRLISGETAAAKQFKTPKNILRFIDFLVEEPRCIECKREFRASAESVDFAHSRAIAMELEKKSHKNENEENSIRTIRVHIRKMQTVSKLAAYWKETRFCQRHPAD
jgi:hypothetical protein